MKTTETIILGHSGFIGNAVLEELNNNHIHTMGISSSDIDLQQPSSIGNLSKIFTADSTLIFSAAVIRQKGETLKILQDNIQITSHVATAIENQPINKCVYLSTADVYGFPTYPITESTPINPQTYYATAKYCSESILQIACRKINIPLLILRYSGIFGPGQKQPRYGPNSFIDTGLKDKTISLWGDGMERRDMVYIKDLANIIVQFSQNDIEGIYNIATGKSHSFLEITEQLKTILPNKFKILSRPRTGIKFDQTFNTTKLQTTLPNLNFSPLDQALHETYLFIKENINI